MKFYILTLFPEMFTGPFDYSIVKRAIQKSFVDITIINIRDFTIDGYKTVDDHPYGGGTGMILRVDVIDRALKSIPVPTKKILLDPVGVPYTQMKATQLSRQESITLVCGHYEGIDERVRTLVDEEISIGDYVLTGGEIPAMALIDSVTRLVPGVLKTSETTRDESFSDTKKMLEYPQYTRPETYLGKNVPDILLSGNHKAIKEWKQNESHKRTLTRRKDLLCQD